MKKPATLLFALMVWSIGVQAADLRVRVFERGGDVPLSGVAVCLGTQARIDQFGAARTDGDGYVLFTAVPHAQVVVTASQSGYRSEQETVVTSNTDRMLVLSLPAGGGGAQCALASAEAERHARLRVTRFRINNGAAVTDKRTVSLDNRLNGTATQYRASERKDMDGAKWQYYAAAPEFTLSEGAGVKRVYLQVRRHSTVNGATLETLSPVVSDLIRLR